MTEVLLVCVFSGICSLDTTAAWQVMFSQPLAASSIAGFVVGQPAAGVVIGIFLQLLWSGSIPVGARPTPDAPVGSIVGVWFASRLLGENPAVGVYFACLAGTLAALALALVGRRTVVLERELNRRLFEGLKHRLRQGERAGPERVQFMSVLLAFSRGLLLCLAAVAVLGPVSSRVAGLNSLSEVGCSKVIVLSGAIGVGVLFNTFVKRTASRLVLFGVGVLFALVLRSASG